MQLQQQSGAGLGLASSGSDSAAASPIDLASSAAATDAATRGAPAARARVRSRASDVFTNSTDADTEYTADADADAATTATTDAFTDADLTLTGDAAAAGCDADAPVAVGELVSTLALWPALSQHGGFTVEHSERDDLVLRLAALQDRVPACARLETALSILATSRPSLPALRKALAHFAAASEAFRAMQPREDPMGVATRSGAKLPKPDSAATTIAGQQPSSATVSPVPGAATSLATDTPPSASVSASASASAPVISVFTGYSAAGTASAGKAALAAGSPGQSPATVDGTGSAAAHVPAAVPTARARRLVCREARSGVGIDIFEESESPSSDIDHHDDDDDEYGDADNCDRELYSNYGYPEHRDDDTSGDDNGESTTLLYGAHSPLPLPALPTLPDAVATVLGDSAGPATPHAGTPTNATAPAHSSGGGGGGVGGIGMPPVSPPRRSRGPAPSASSGVSQTQPPRSGLLRGSSSGGSSGGGGAGSGSCPPSPGPAPLAAPSLATPSLSAVATGSGALSSSRGRQQERLRRRQRRERGSNDADVDGLTAEGSGAESDSHGDRGHGHSRNRDRDHDNDHTDLEASVARYGAGPGAADGAGGDALAQGDKDALFAAPEPQPTLWQRAVRLPAAPLRALAKRAKRLWTPAETAAAAASADADGDNTDGGDATDTGRGAGAGAGSGSSSGDVTSGGGGGAGSLRARQTALAAAEGPEPRTGTRPLSGTGAAAGAAPPSPALRAATRSTAASSSSAAAAANAAARASAAAARATAAAARARAVWPVHDMTPRLWRRCCAAFAVSALQFLLKTLFSVMLVELRALRECRQFWKARMSPSGLARWRQLYANARSHVVTLGRVEAEMVRDVGRLHAQIFYLSCITCFGGAPFADGAPIPASAWFPAPPTPPTHAHPHSSVHGHGHALSPVDSGDHAAASTATITPSPVPSAAATVATLQPPQMARLSSLSAQMGLGQGAATPFSTGARGPAATAAALSAQAAAYALPPAAYTAAVAANAPPVLGDDSASSGVLTMHKLGANAATPVPADATFETLGRMTPLQQYVFAAARAVNADAPPPSPMAAAAAGVLTADSALVELVRFSRGMARWLSFTPQQQTALLAVAHVQGEAERAPEASLMAHPADVAAAAEAAAAAQREGEEAARAVGIQSREDVTPEFLVELVASFADLVPKHEAWFQRRVALYAPPSHWRRNWMAYLAIAATGLGVGLWAHSNQDRVAEATASMVLSAKHFFYEHIQEPIENITKKVFSAFFNDRVERQSELPTAATIAESRRDLRQMLLDFGRDFASDIAEAEKTSKAAFLQSLPDRAARVDMSVVMSKYTTDIQKPLSNITSGSLVRGLLIQVQKVKADGEEAMLDMDQIIEQNEINFNMLATIPAILVAGGTLLAVKRATQSLWRRAPAPKVLLFEMRLVLSKIEMLLIDVAAPSPTRATGMYTEPPFPRPAPPVQTAAAAAAAQLSRAMPAVLLHPRGHMPAPDAVLRDAYAFSRPTSHMHAHGHGHGYGHPQSQQPGFAPTPGQSVREQGRPLSMFRSSVADSADLAGAAASAGGAVNANANAGAGIGGAGVSTDVAPDDAAARTVRGGPGRSAGQTSAHATQADTELPSLQSLTLDVVSAAPTVAVTPASAAARAARAAALHNAMPGSALPPTGPRGSGGGVTGAGAGPTGSRTPGVAGSDVSAATSPTHSAGSFGFNLTMHHAGTDADADARSLLSANYYAHGANGGANGAGTNGVAAAPGTSYYESCHVFGAAPTVTGPQPYNPYQPQQYQNQQQQQQQQYQQQYGGGAAGGDALSAHAAALQSPAAGAYWSALPGAPRQSFAAEAAALHAQAQAQAQAHAQAQAQAHALGQAYAHGNGYIHGHGHGHGQFAYTPMSHHSAAAAAGGLGLGVGVCSAGTGACCGAYTCGAGTDVGTGAGVNAGAVRAGPANALWSQVHLNDRDTGYLLLYVCILEELVAQLPRSMKESVKLPLARALAGLKSHHLTVQQKIMIVHHLYRAYDFFSYKSHY